MTEAISFVLGAILPPFIDLVNNKISDNKVRYMVSVLACIIIAFGVNVVSKDATNIGKLFEGSSAVSISVQKIYKLFWKESDIRANFLK